MQTIAKVGKVGVSKPMKVRGSCSRVVGVGCAGNREARTMIYGGLLGACDDLSIGVSPAKAAARPDGVRGDRFDGRMSSRDVPPTGGRRCSRVG